MTCRIASDVAMERPATPAGPIGLILPTFAQDLPSERDRPLPGPSGDGAPVDTFTGLAAVSREAEEAGADALWACDHLFWHGPTLECLTALTVAAGATARAMIGSCILQLPLRQPAAVAKQAATIQTLSGGRFVLGVGVGSHPGEYVRAGVDYAGRGQALDAAVAELRRCWSSAREPATGREAGEGSAPAGESGPARPPYRQLPEPPPVPVWIGGSSHAARRRAATSGDGWIPLFVDVDRYRDDVEALASEAAAAGRDPADITPAVVLFVSVDEDPVVALRRGTRWMSSMYALPSRAFERHLVSGTAQEVADVVNRYRAAGAKHIALYVTDDRPLPQFGAVVAALSLAGVPAGR